MTTILHVGQFGYPWEVRFGKLSRALRDAGFQVAMLARRRPGERASEEQAEGRVYRTGPPGLLSTPVPGNLLWTRRLNAVARQTDAKVILVRDIPLALNAARVARSRRIPLLLDMAEHYPEAMRSWKKYTENPVLRTLVHTWRLPDHVERRAVRCSDGIIVVCEEQRDRLVRDHGYAADRICIVRNTPEADSVARELPGADDRPRTRFGYHGILCDDRELENVLRGFERAAATMPDISLLVAGGGESEDELRELGSGLKAKDRIRFTGRYAPDDLPALYAETDFGVVSLRKNTFTEHTVGNKFFDYAALGKPFIFPAIKPLLRLMKQMSCGIPFTPGSPESVADAISRIREADYHRLSENGVRSIREELNWSVDAAVLSEFVGRYARE